MTVHYADDTVTLYHGDALDVLRTLPDKSVHCCVTSPPYFGLRDYGVAGQYGLEDSPSEYAETMRRVFSEVRRLLADDGTLWLNLGDSYAHSGSGRQGSGGQRADRAFTAEGVRGTTFLPAKNLLGIPWRVAFRLQDDGWILRCEVIWAKRNLMPESVRDRPTRAHEQVFLFAKRPQYWYDADAIREESDSEYAAHTVSHPGKGGRNARSVWSISAQPFPGAHFAVMPPELARRSIAAGCRPGGVVLDPFCGSGTTGMVAQQLGRRFIGIDLSREYLDLALRTRLAQGVLPLEVAS